MTLPSCLECKFDNRGFPCRTLDSFDHLKVAKAYFENVLSDTSESEQSSDHWSYSCVSELESEHPRLAWDVILAIVPLLKEPRQAALLAAGPLENLIATNGEIFIKDIEDLAKRSARFRFVLSGVWSQGQSAGAIWARVEAARRAGPAMDDGAPLPVD